MFDDALSLLSLGGPILYLLLAISIAATTVFFERLWALQRRLVAPAGLRDAVLARARGGRVADALAISETSATPLGRVMTAALRRSGLDRAAMREAVTDQGRREVLRLERFGSLLGTTATVSPLLGLLGTITGMIDTFRSVSANGPAAANAAGQLASGIWEALLTTAGGLIVAIPAFLAFRVVASTVDRRAGELEEAALDLVEALDPHASGATAP
ncbi:MAG: MotA/TolQ/ExbB proton channel family protein [Myxococcales bacterium]|nr:MotA/TolQ/ExbB proton channel family protein [Myxococcales bacterium]